MAGHLRLLIGMVGLLTSHVPSLVESEVLGAGARGMSHDSIRAVAETENQDDLHLGRLLVLLWSADAQKRKPEQRPRRSRG